MPTTTESRAFKYGTTTRSIQGVIRVEYTTAGQLNIQLRANPDDSNTYKAYNGWTDSKSPTYSLTVDGTTYTGKWNFDWRTATQTIVTAITRNLTTTKTAINISGVLDSGKQDNGTAHPLGIATIPSTSFSTGITVTTTTTAAPTTTTTTRAPTTTTTTTTTVAPTPVFTDSTIIESATMNVSYSDAVAASNTSAYSVVGVTESPTGFFTVIPGVFLNKSTGTISGIPIAQGSYSFTIRATSSALKTADISKTILTGPPGKIGIEQRDLTTAKRFIGIGQTTTNAQGQTISADASGYVSLSRMQKYNSLTAQWENITNT